MALRSSSVPMSPDSIHAHPAWFGSVMGSAGLAIVLSNEAETWQAAWIDVIAAAVLIVAIDFAVALMWFEMAAVGVGGYAQF